MISLGIAVCQNVLRADFGLRALRARIRHVIPAGSLYWCTEVGKEIIPPLAVLDGHFDSSLCA